MLQLFDTHAHLDLDHYKNDSSQVIDDSFAGKFPANVSIDDFSKSTFFKMAGILCVGITCESSQNAVAIASRYTSLYAAVGIHPNSCTKNSISDWGIIVELAGNKGVVAIGETGLDKYWDTVPFETQLTYFEKHLDLAEKLKKPVLIHSRNCDAEMLDLLSRRTKRRPLCGVIHSFSSSASVAKQFLEMGLHISFSGSVTYKNKKFEELHEAAKQIPADRLLLETDAPFLTPHPYRGKLTRNVPLMTAYTAQALAKLRGDTIENIAAMTTKNAQELFGI